MNRNLRDLVAGTSELRALPSTTVRLLELLDDATAAAEDVLAVIGKDPSLTANLLKLCNSAYYGLRAQVSTTREALVHLGNTTVVNLAFAASMGDILRGPLGAYRLGPHEMWHHALATAVGAGFLAGRGGDRQARERAFTGGLVHDMGKLLTNRELAGHLDQLPPSAAAQDMRAAEIAILGFDHAAAGAALAEAWNLPQSLVQVVAAHHLPVSGNPAWAEMDAATRHIAGCVAMANLVAAAEGFSGGSAAPDGDQLLAAAEEVGVAAADLGALRARLAADLDGMLATLGDVR